MKLKTLYLENFRCYKERISIHFDDLTAFIGKNDIGKSTILEALEIFFNNDLVKIDSSDANIHGGKEVIITCDFCELPTELVLDSGERTNLSEEYLTISDDLLRIKKVYDCSKSSKSSKILPVVYIVANHPCATGVENLLSLKERDLQRLVRERGLEAPLRGNPAMRKAIWNSVENLDLQECEIEISKAKEEGKEIWSRIDSYLPNFALFQSDRTSHDSDGEVQNPMKAAIQEAISEVQEEINVIQEKVRDKAMLIAEQTQIALKSIDENLANRLSPKFTLPTASKWNGLFSIAMDTDEGIALNKRGSGIRRMILVGFFKAEAERKALKSNKKDIIYAIEEPETSQHPNSQKILIKSFIELAESESCQVILTTHSPGLAQELPIDSLRFVDRDAVDNPIVLSDDGILSMVTNALGILPDTNRDIRIFLCLEGPTDVIAFKCFSRCLRTKYPEVIDLENDKRVFIVPMGGSSLKHWVEKQYFKDLGFPEIHIYDNDVETYQESIDRINRRGDKSWGTLMKKREVENYLHPKAIKDIYGVDVDTSQDDVPKLFGLAYSEKNQLNGTMKGKRAKSYLSRVFQEGMTIEYLEEIDPEGEVKGLFDKMSSMLEE